MGIRRVVVAISPFVVFQRVFGPYVLLPGQDAASKRGPALNLRPVTETRLTRYSHGAG